MSAANVCPDCNQPTCSDACRQRRHRRNRAARETASLARLDELLARLTELATKKDNLS